MLRDIQRRVPDGKRPVLASAQVRASPDMVTSQAGLSRPAPVSGYPTQALAWVAGLERFSRKSSKSLLWLQDSL